LMPAATAPARNPRGVVTLPPETHSIDMREV
jgi:hypothetical protein